MTTTRTAAHQTHTDVPGRGTVVLGVDGSERNQAAIAWAKQEAADLGAEVLLVSASPPFNVPMTTVLENFSPAVLEASAAEHLRGLGEQFTHPPRTHVETGTASRLLTEQAIDATLLVVGKRGLGAVSRLLVGSTSIAVAGRSSVPVVVVPDTWAATGKSSRPIVAGLEVHEGSGTGPVSRDVTVLDFAFERADRLGVPVVVVSAWETPPMFAWSPVDLSNWRADREEVTARALKPWTMRYPGVEVVVAAPAGNASNAVLDAAATAQMVVLGRHTRPSHVGGFSVGSTARGVLHYADVPVVVTPDLPANGSSVYRDPEDVAAPMF